MKLPAYRPAALLRFAAILSLAGQCTAIVFMLWANPFTTFVFMTAGVGMIAAGMALYGFVIYREIKARTEGLLERHFRAGEYVFRQGDQGDRIYVLKHGEVEVVREDPEKGETVIARLQEGDYFGEMALLSDAPRSASIRAAGEVTTLSIERQEFYELYASIPAFHESVATALARHNRR